MTDLLDRAAEAPRCGDTVLHHPTGEHWLVAYVDGDRLAWCGWPEGEGRLSDCSILERCSDAEHVTLLREVAGIGPDDRRARMAAARLAELEAAADRSER